MWSIVIFGLQFKDVKKNIPQDQIGSKGLPLLRALAVLEYYQLACGVFTIPNLFPFLLLVYAMVFTIPIYAEPAFMNFMTLGGSWSLSYTVCWLNYALVLVMKFYDLDNFNWKLWFTCSPFIIVLFGVNAYDILESLCLNNLICKFLVFLLALPLIYGS